MAPVQIKVINRSDNPVPQYATPGSAGMDLRAFLDAPVSLQPMERRLIPTGLFLQIPDGYEGQVRPRSGLALNQGITCLNSPGTVDSDYRGEIKVILINLSGEPQVLHSGDRIAQLVIHKVEIAEIAVADRLSETARSTGGFGSTGKT